MKYILSFLIIAGIMTAVICVQEIQKVCNNYKEEVRRLTLKYERQYNYQHELIDTLYKRVNMLDSWKQEHMEDYEVLKYRSYHEY